MKIVIVIEDKPTDDMPRGVSVLLEPREQVTLDRVAEPTPAMNIAEQMLAPIMRVNWKLHVPH